MRIVYTSPIYNQHTITATNTNSLYPINNLFQTTRTKFWKANSSVTNLITIDYLSVFPYNAQVAVFQNTNIYPFSSGTYCTLRMLRNTAYQQDFTLNSANFLNNRAYFYAESPVVLSGTQLSRMEFLNLNGSFIPQLSYIFCGQYLSLTQNGFDLNFSFGLVDNSKKNYNNLGVAFVEANNLLQRSLSFSINNMNKTELTSILAWINYCKKDKPFFVFMDENQNIIANKYELGGMFLFDSIGEIQHTSFGLYSISMTAIEVV